MTAPQTKFTTSFIPKKPVVPSATVVRSGSSIFTLIASMIFIASLVVAGGMYFYKQTIIAQIEGQKEEIAQAWDEFDPKLVSVAKKLDDRINAIKTLSDNHKSPSAIFALLEDSTLGSVRFSGLSYKDDSAGNILIDANGMGLSFNSIVLQSDEFGKTGVLQDVVFSSVQSTESGLVSFSFNSKVDNQLVLYKKGLVPVQSDSDKDDKKSDNKSGI